MHAPTQLDQVSHVVSAAHAWACCGQLWTTQPPQARDEPASEAFPASGVHWAWQDWNVATLSWAQGVCAMHSKAQSYWDPSCAQLIPTAAHVAPALHAWRWLHAWSQGVPASAAPEVDEDVDVEELDVELDDDVDVEPDEEDDDVELVVAPPVPEVDEAVVVEELDDDEVCTPPVPPPLDDEELPPGQMQGE
jgi:hypothetical protein